MPVIDLARERSLYTAFAERAVATRQRDLAELQEQMATGRRINRASDDAAGYTQARRLDALDDRYAQYGRAIDAARFWTDETQQALDDLANLFSEAYEEAIRFKNDTYSEEDRRMAADRIEELFQAVVERLNGKVGDEYLFAGSRTTNTPFDRTGDVVSYEGDGGGRRRQVGRDLTLEVNVSGDRVLDTGDGYTITESLVHLKEALQSGDQDALQAAFDEVIGARDHAIDLGAEVGTIARRLNMAETQLQDGQLLLEARRSGVQDADLAETLMELQRAQASLQASLHVSASVLQTSLLDYLR